MRLPSSIPDNMPPVLIGCCSSSGSTLLSVILDAHPRIMCGNELHFFSHPFVWKARGMEWRMRLLEALGMPQVLLRDWTLENGFVPHMSLGKEKQFTWYGHGFRTLGSLIKKCDSGPELADLFFSQALEMRHKSIWIEKTPANIYGMSSFLDSYPESKGIVIVRDGRDVICSLKNRGYSLSLAARKWLIETAMSVELSKSPRVLLVKYEDLIHSTFESLARITNFLQVEFAEERMREYMNYTDRDLRNPRESIPTWKNVPQQGIKSTSVNRWQYELPEDELEAFYSYKIINQNVLLPDNPLPSLTTPELLKLLGYSVPDGRSFTWRGFAKVISTEWEPSVDEKTIGKLYKHNTTLSIPNGVEQALSPSDFLLLLQHLSPNHYKPRRGITLWLSCFTQFLIRVLQRIRFHWINITAN